MARPFWLTRFLVRSGIARFLPAANRLTGGGTQYLRYLSDRLLAAPVEELLDPAFFPQAAGPDVIDLNLPAPRGDSGISAGRVAADRRGTPPAWGTAELRSAVAERYLRRDGRLIDPETQVFVTHGATGALAAVLDAFIDPGDRVVLFDPCSPLFTLGATSRRADIRRIPTWSEGGRIHFLSRDLERAMKRAKLLLLSDPVNPTGGCFHSEDFEQIAWLASRYRVLVYLDESFARFRYESGVPTLFSCRGADGLVLTADSVSQGWSLGSVRVGWLTGPAPLVRACALSASLNAPYVAAICQHIAARAIAEPDSLFDSTLESLRGRRQYTFDRLRAMGLEPDWPGGGYFIWVPVSPLGLDGRAFAVRLYRDCGVLVGPGLVYGPSGAGHIRISFAAEDGRLREGLDRLGEFIQRLRGTAPPQTMPVREDSEPMADEELEDSRPLFSRA